MRARVIKRRPEKSSRRRLGSRTGREVMAAHTPWPCTGATGPAPAAAADAAPAMPGSLASAAGPQNANPRMV